MRCLRVLFREETALLRVRFFRFGGRTRSLVISNIEMTFLPSNTASRVSSARTSRLSLGSWSSCLRMYSQSFLVKFGSGEWVFADHCGQCGVGLYGFAKGAFSGGGFLRAIRTCQAWQPSEKSTLFERFAKS